MKLLVQTSKSVSLSEVGRQIGYVAEQKGYIVVLNREFPQWTDYRKVANKMILVHAISPLWSTGYFAIYHKAKRELDGNVLFYATCEGVPKPHLFPEWVFSEVEFVANSRFTKLMLKRAGFRVREVIHHGVCEAEVEEAIEYIPKYREIVERYFKDRVSFAFVGDDVFRKNIDKLIEAVSLLSQKRDDFVIFIISKQSVKRKIAGNPFIYYVADMGSRLHSEILAFYGSCNYTVYSGSCDGFGLPILESMRMGTPVIHCWCDPYREFSTNDGNIVFDYTNEKIVDTGDGIDYIYYEYDVKELASALDNAIDIYKKYKSQYEEMKIKVEEQAKRFKAEELYSKLIDMIGKKGEKKVRIKKVKSEKEEK